MDVGSDSGGGVRGVCGIDDNEGGCVLCCRYCVECCAMGVEGCVVGVKGCSVVVKM